MTTPKTWRRLFERDFYILPKVNWQFATALGNKRPATPEEIQSALESPDFSVYQKIDGFVIKAKNGERWFSYDVN